MDKETWEKEREIKKELGKRALERMKQPDVPREKIITKSGKEYLRIGNRYYTKGPKGELRRVRNVNR
jgi:hypothetical protein